MCSACVLSYSAHVCVVHVSFGLMHMCVCVLWPNAHVCMCSACVLSSSARVSVVHVSFGLMHMCVCVVHVSLVLVHV